MRELTYHPKADDEVLGSARFYERRSQGLGWRFLRTIREAEARITNNPWVFPALDDEIRKCVLRGFPFSLLFRIDDEDIFVVAVAHHSRRPGYSTESPPNMIKDEQELQATQERIQQFQRWLTAIRQTARPDEFDAVASGYRLEIERMQAEVLECLLRLLQADAPERQLE